ncbi:DUF6868 family protein [Thalassotalea piscium]|uniref:DUF6868 domain-containing protein n=1 Tax=Thalassotalea piscium TaxID=1230533 RepID=A0A7X0TSP7_9GAMM|nr:hypothetical protein [Thalassotalea piscium]
MISLVQLTEVLGWISIINIVFLVVASLLVITMKSFLISIHGKMFDISEKDLTLIYFKYIAQHKALSFVFIFSPYIALKILGY